MATSEPTNARAPFDSPDADVILRSYDGEVDFRTFKLLLSLASPVFKDMFHMPQPASGSSANNDVKDGPPVVQMYHRSERSRTLEVVLGFCHPNCMPTLERLDVIDDVLAVARKFEMDAMLKWARAKLVRPSFMEGRQALLAFDIASKHNLEDEEKILAKATLRIPEAEFNYIPYSARLRTYRDKCCLAALKLTTSFMWVELDKDLVWNRCNSCETAGRIEFKYYDRWWPRQWWIDYMRFTGIRLDESPTAKVILGREMIEWVMRATVGCETCGRWAGPDIQKFNQKFSEQVERVTSEVELSPRT